jgi:hypothetical protein
MNQLIEKSLLAFQTDLLITNEVDKLLREMVESVSLHRIQNDFLRLKDNLQVTENLNIKLLHRIRLLENHYNNSKKELSDIKQEGKIVREKFAGQIGYFLSENRKNKQLKDRIFELEEILARIKPEDLIEEDTEEKDPNDNESPNQSESTVEGNTVPTALVPKEPVFPRKLFELEETPLLLVFSFLHTVEVLNYAQVCRYMYQRIDKIFGIDSALVQVEWSVMPTTIKLVIQGPETPSTSTSILSGPPSVEAAAKPTANKVEAENPNEPRLTREMVDILTKRLNGELIYLFSLKSFTLPLFRFSPRNESNFRNS